MRLPGHSRTGIGYSPMGIDQACANGVSAMRIPPSHAIQWPACHNLWFLFSIGTRF